MLLTVADRNTKQVEVHTFSLEVLNDHQVCLLLDGETIINFEGYEGIKGFLMDNVVKNKEHVLKFVSGYPIKIDKNY